MKKTRVEYIEPIEQDHDEEKMTLWKINDEISHILQELGEADDESKAEVESLLEDLEMQLEQKLENIGYFLMNQREKISNLEAGIKRLTSWRDRLKRGIEWLSKYTVGEMQRADIKKIESEFMTISRRKKPVRTEVAMTPDGEIDYDAIDDRFVKQEIRFSVDKRAAIALYKRHKDTGGVHIIGIQFIDDEESLVVK